MKTLTGGQTPPRILIFYLAVFAKIAASALSAVGFVLKSALFMVTGTFVWLIFFSLLLLVAVPATDRRLDSRAGWLRPAAGIMIIVLLITGIFQSVLVSVIGLQVLYRTHPESTTGRLFTSLERVFGYNDATALTHQAAGNFLKGENPYLTANIVTAGTKYNIATDKLTPVRTGRLADAFPYPVASQMEDLWQEAVRNPAEPPAELESRFNYPAGSFLLPALFIWPGVKDIRLIYLILLLPALTYTIVKIPKGSRTFFLAALLASLELWNSLAAGETGFLYFPFLLLAWILYRRHIWLSTFFLAIAAATKQVPWFTLPFYFVLVGRTAGIKKAVFSLLLLAAVFIGANVTFFLPDPGFWLSSITAPLSERLFPLGVGVVSFVSSGILDIRSPLPFTILEIAVGVAALGWYFFNCRRYPHTGPVLSVLPLFFSWRSLWGYFFYVDIIMLAAIMIDEYGRPSSEEIPLEK